MTSTKCISSSCRFLLKILAKGRLSRKRKRLGKCQMKRVDCLKNFGSEDQGVSDYKINCHFNLCGRLRTKSKSKALSLSFAMSPCPSFLSATHSERNRKMIKNRRAWSWSTEKRKGSKEGVTCSLSLNVPQEKDNENHQRMKPQLPHCTC